MASAAEQLVANLSFSSLAKAEELKKRLWFTLGALIVYRLGTYLPLPGINSEAVAEAFSTQGGGLLTMLNGFTGGAISRLAILTLGVIPYINAAIFIQLVSTSIPRLDQLKKEGEQGRQVINQYTRYLTVILATIQSYGIAVGLESAEGIVVEPGWFFRFTTVVTLVGGTMFLMWLGEQITSRGVGNGVSLIIFAGIVAELPVAIVNLLRLGETGALATPVMLGIIVMAVLVIGFVVFMERAQRRLIVQYPKRQMGNRMFQGDSSHLPLKLNTAGVMPPILTSMLLASPITLFGFLGSGEQSGWAATFAAYLGRGQPVYLILYASLIVLFAYFWIYNTATKPSDMADNLKKQGGFIPGYRPGARTAEYIEYVLNRITAVGAAYLVLVCILPEVLVGRLQVPFAFGGTALLIVVSVTMDTVAQIQGHLLAHQYEGLVKKSKLRGKRR